MKIKGLVIIGTFFLVSTPFFIHAQEEEFNISIADKTEEPLLLAQHQWQAEGGFLYNRYQDSGPSSIAQLFLRHSVSEKLELRLLIEDGKERDRYISETVQATYPLAIGAKFKVLEHHAYLPDMALVGYLQIPFTAHTKAQRGYWSPMLFMAFQHQLGEKWSLTYNAGGLQEAFGTSWSALANGSVHFKIVDALEIFSEYFAQYEPHELPQHNLGGGATCQLNEHFAVYLSGGRSFGADQWNSFFSCGLAARY